MNNKILVVDDEKDIRELTCTYLRNEGYFVEESDNGEVAINMIKENNYDLVILDIMMPNKNGYDVLSEIRKDSIVPIIFLTAKVDELSMIQGFTLGADDYIRKPFSSMELLVRVKAQLRRYNQYTKNTNVIKIDQLTIDIDKYKVTILDKDIDLTPTQYKILLLFCKNQGVVFSLEQIYESVWNNEEGVSNATIMMHITKLRQRIETDSKNPQYIKTVWGVGYKV